MRFLTGKRGMSKRMTTTIVKKQLRTDWFDSVVICIEHFLIVAQGLALLKLVV